MIFPSFSFLLPTFQFPLPQTWLPRLGPHISARWTFFKKAHLRFYFASSNQFPKETPHLIPNMATPPTKNIKSAVFAQFWPFLVKPLGHCCFLCGLVSLQEAHCSTQNYNCKWSLKKCLMSWDLLRYVDIFAGLFDQNQKYWSLLGVDLENMGQIASLPSKYLLDSKFNADCDSTVKHAPIQSYNWVVGIYAILKLR